MVFGFGKKKERVTPEEFGDILWELCRSLYNSRFKDDFHSALKEAEFTIDTSLELDIDKEALIINLWLVSKVLGEEKQSLEYMHKMYYSFFAKTFGKEVKELQERRDFLSGCQERLHERYARYHKAWDPDAGPMSLLSLEMLECLLSESDKKTMNALLSFAVDTYIVSAMQTILEYRDRYKIT